MEGGTRVHGVVVGGPRNRRLERDNVIPAALLISLQVSTVLLRGLLYKSATRCQRRITDLIARAGELGRWHRLKEALLLRCRQVRRASVPKLSRVISPNDLRTLLVPVKTGAEQSRTA